MVTKATRRRQRQRPTGITILAILEFIGAIFGILGGIALLALGGASVVSGGNVGGGGNVGSSGNVVSGADLLILGVVALVIGVVDLVLGYGFWTLQPWARLLGIGLQTLGLVVEVISIVRSALVSAFVGCQCLSIIISVIVLLYLNGPEVRHAFDREPQPPGYPPSGYPPSGYPPSGYPPSGSPPNAPAPYGGYAPPSGYGQAGGYGQYAPPSYPMGPGYPPSGYPPQPPQGNYPQPGASPPPPPHYGYPQPFAPLTQPETGGGFAIAGLVLGIVSIPIALFAICGYITAILGIIFSILGRRAPSKRTMATIGLVLSVLGFLAAIGSSIVGVMMGQRQYSITGSGSTFATATATATATAVPTPPHWQTVVYQEPFTAAAAGWPNDVGRCYFKDGAYHAASYASDVDRACYAPIGKQTSFDLTVDVKQLGGDTKAKHGLVFARDGSNDYYEFGIDSEGGWDLFKCTGLNVYPPCAVWLPSWKLAGIRTGLNATNKVEVVATGGHFWFLVNGMLVCIFNDAKYTSGKFGVFTGSLSESAFNNFRVTRPG